MTESSFPAELWGSRSGVLARFMGAFAKTKVGSATIKAIEPLDRAVLKKSNGRFTMVGPIGAPILLLETTGRKSGLTRTHVLLFGRDEKSIYIAGSNFGGEDHPAWSHNLVAEPHSVVVIRGKRIPVLATQLEGDELDRGYQHMIDVNDVYSVYRQRTDRQIRVFRLDAL